MLSMITSQAISISSVLGSMSRSLQLLNILSMFDIQGPGLKVKVTVAIFRKTLLYSILKYSEYTQYTALYLG